MLNNSSSAQAVYDATKYLERMREQLTFEVPMLCQAAASEINARAAIARLPAEILSKIFDIIGIDLRHSSESFDCRFVIMHV